MSFLPFGALESLRADLGLTYAQAGLLLMLIPAGGLLGTPLKVAADYVSRRLLASLGAAVYAACLLAFALGGSFPVLAIAAFAWGAASDALNAGCEVALTDLAGNRLDRALGMVNTLAAVGDMLGPLTLAAAAASGLGWRPALALAAAVMAAYAAWLAARPLPPPPRTRERVHTAVLDVARDSRVLKLGLLVLVIGLLDEPFLGFAIAYLQQVRGQPEAVATLVAGAVVGGGLAGSAAMAAASLGTAIRLRVPSAALAAVSTAALVLAPGAPLQAAASFLLGAAVAVCWVWMQAAILQIRPGQAGTTGAVVSTVELAGAGFPVLVGAAADARGLTVGLWCYVAAAALLAVLAARWRSLSGPSGPRP